MNASRAGLRNLLTIKDINALSLRPRAPRPGSMIASRRMQPPPILAASAPAERKEGGSPRSKPASQPRRNPNRGGARAAPTGGGLQRLNKALAAVGVASRRGADEMVFAGRVSVNGAVVKEPGMQVDLSKDKLSLDGRQLSTAAASKKYYFALNKPKGYVCSSQGDGLGGSGDRLVVHLFDTWLAGWKSRHPGSGAPPRFFTVGRLDVQSVGLIFITNDGDWAQEVLHPSSGLTKEYSVTLNKRPGRAEMTALAAGCEIDGVMISPVAVSIDDSDASKRTRIRVILSEGRNREVRKLVEAAGLEVEVLRRVRMGGYRLPRTLAFGQFVELRPHEVRRVLNLGADRSV